jgi:hypothetical protein
MARGALRSGAAAALADRVRAPRASVPAVSPPIHTPGDRAGAAGRSRRSAARASSAASPYRLPGRVAPRDGLADASCGRRRAESRPGTSCARPAHRHRAHRTADAITDVRGVGVGHVTPCGATSPPPAGASRGPASPGSRAGRPSGFSAPVAAGAVVLNGAGEMTGLLHVSECGVRETPVSPTATRAVGRVYHGAVLELLAAYHRLER